MIARVARFASQRDRFTSGHRYTYVLDAVKAVPGCLGAYHMANEDGALSVTFFEDEAAMRAGESAVKEARERLQVEGSPPDQVEVFEVSNSTRT